MITYDNGGRLIESVEELPQFDRIRNLYGDFETTSGHAKKDSKNPWHSCKVLGFGFTVDDCPNAFYIPARHQFGKNLPLATIQRYIKDLVSQCERWTNHNIKYDLHVAKNDLDIDPPEQVQDTLTTAKLIDSDLQFKGGYGLDALSKRWLNEDISRYEAALKPYLKNNKDYARIPSDIAGEYGCQDAITERLLDRHITAALPESCREVYETENRLTYVLYHIERLGLRIEPMQLELQEMRNCNEMIRIDEELTALVGRSFRPHVNADCYDVLCNQYGLPVLSYTQEDDEETGEKQGNPSFDKYALEMYLSHPLAPKRVIVLIQEYRKRDMMNRFVAQYKELHVDGLLHGSYNQSVRTGRMGCSKPNLQQLNSEMKRLMLPHVGCAFMSADYSQIEMRTIAHYIQDEELIRRYNEDENTDLHKWVASLQPGLDRDAGKTLNFSVAFGLGREKTVKKLAVNPKVVGALTEEIQKLVTGGKLHKDQAKNYFDALCFERGASIYDTYHALLPGIKQTSYRAADACRQRGYVFDLAGRRRHIPRDKSHIAFNTINQASAADIMKERTVALWYATRGTGIDIAASVHDETLCHGPTEVMQDERTINDIAYTLENSAIKLRVPIKIGYGVSAKTWFHAAKGPKYDDKTGALVPEKSGEGGKKIKTGEFTDFRHLRTS